MSRASGLPLLLALLLPACGRSPTGPSNANVDGYWEMVWDDMTGLEQGVKVDCTTDLSWHLNQSGSAFSGFLTEVGLLLCVKDGQVIVASPVSSEVISSGIISGNQIAFRLGSVGGTHSGTVNDTLMSGTARWEIGVGDNGTVVLTGNWSAHRLQ